MILAGVFGWLAEMSPWAIERVANLLGDNSITTLSISGPTFSGLGSVARKLRMTKSERLALFVVIQFYTVLGLITGVALVARLRPRIQVALLVVYAVWLASLAAQLLYFIAQYVTGGVRESFVGLHVMPQVISISLATGVWLASLAVALGSVGVVLMWRARRAGASSATDAHHQSQRARSGRTWAERCGAGVATAGIVVWIAGFFALPWVTQGCDGPHFSLSTFVTSSCAGMNASDVMIRAPLAQALSLRAWYVIGPDFTVWQALRFLWTTDALYLLLALTACWALLRLWVGAGDARRYGWSLVWLVVAAMIAALAFQGSRSDLRDPLALGNAIASLWVYGLGLAVTFAGLTLAAIGLVGALASRWRLARRR
jgi:hypothetical protein